MNIARTGIIIACIATSTCVSSPVRADIVFTDTNGIFTSLEPPGSVGALAGKANDAGTVVGFFSDASSFTHGFTYNNGVYSQVDVAGHSNTALVAINDAGVMVGSYDDPASQLTSFIYDNGVITTINPPNSILTGVSAINASNIVVGYYYISGNYNSHGFVYDNGTYSSLDVPGAIWTEPLGINNAGVVVGTYEDASMKQHGFIDNNGVFTTFDVPGANFTVLEDINNSGEMAGYAVSASGAFGFVTQGATINSINYPVPSYNTFLRGINDSNMIVGDANANVTVPEPSSMVLLIAGLFGCVTSAACRGKMW